MSPLPEVYVGPGEVFATDRPVLAKVILGSCIAVTLYCNRTGMAAVNHAMLPTGTPGNTRHVDISIRSLLDWFERKGVRHSELQVGLFGGSKMLSGPIRNGTDILDVGKMNTVQALAVLKEYGLTPKIRDVGGANGRRLKFNTSNGTANITKIASSGKAFRK